jgi:hypothetical protein
MAFKVCAKCAKQVRVVDHGCWSCGSTEFLADLVEGSRATASEVNRLSQSTTGAAVPRRQAKDALTPVQIAAGLGVAAIVMMLLIWNEATVPSLSAGSPTMAQAVKKNGTVDDRPNDLVELCKDYIFYSGQIMKKTAAGDQAGAAKARASFQQVNRWLSEYPEDDVSRICAALRR